MRKNFTQLITKVNSIKWRPQIVGLLLLFLMLVSQTAVGQTVSSISPTCKTAGEGDFVLTINGSDFNGNPIVTFNGTTVSFTVSSNNTVITAQIPATLIATAGNYEVRVTKGNTSSSRNLLVAPRTNAGSITTSQTNVCEGSQGVIYSIAAVAGAQSYSWTVPSGATIVSGATTNQITVNFGTNASSGTVTVAARNACGTLGTTSTLSVTVNPLPTAPTTTSNSRCGTGIVQLSASGAPTDGSYRWYTSGGTVISGATAATYTTPSISTTTSYWVSTVSAAGCESVSRTEVVATINAIPDAPTTTSNSRCGAGIVELSASSPLSNVSYRWYTVSSGGTAISNVTGPTYSPNLTTTTTYWVSVVSAAGCESTSRTAVTATVNEVPLAPSTTSDDRCGAGTVTLSASGTPSGGSYRWYTLANGGTAITGATGATYSPNVTETTTYYVSAVSAADCEGPRTAVIATVNPVPTVQITNPEAVCTPSTVNLQAATVTAGSTSGLTYTYWRDAGATLILLNPDQVSTSGTYYIKGTTPEGCFDIKPVAVVVNQTPNAPTLANTPNEICGSGTTQLSVSGTPTGGRYQWYTSETGATAIAGAESSTYTTPTISVTTTYYVSSISAEGCESATRTAVTAVVNPIPGAATVSTPEARCGAGPVSMTATEGTNANSARWYSAANGGTLLFTGLTYAPTNVSATTTFYVSSYNTETGCESTTRTAVTATVITPPTVTATTTTPTTFCVGGSVMLSAQVSPATPEQGNYTYQWRKNGINITSTGATNATFTATETGDYTVVVSTNVGGCVSAPSNQVTVTVLPQPTASVSGGNQAKCIGANNSTSFTVSGTFANGNAQWTSSNSSFSIQNPSYNTTTGIATATVVATGTGSSTIKLTTSNANASCNDASSEITLTVNPLPVASIVPTGPTTFCEGEYVVLEATEAPVGQTYSYEWFINNGSQVIGTDQTYEASVTGSYTVRITTQAGCSATSSPIAVKVDQLTVATVSVTGATTFCEGGSVRLDAVKAPSGQTAYAYQWYRGNETVGTNSSTYIAEATGEYYVVVSAQGCDKTSDIISVTVLPQPTASITAPAESARTVCQDTDGVTTFTVSGTFSGGEAAWTSSNSSFVISGRNDVLNSSTGITTSTITVTVSGVLTSTISSTINLRTTNPAASCAPANSSISLTVNPIPIATITPSSDTEFCAGNSITLTASEGSSYLWSTGATTRVITVSISGDYSVTVTNSSGCSITSPVTAVKVNPLPEVTLAAFEPVCKDQEAFTLSGGLPAGGTYTINGVVVTEFNPASFTVGNHTIVYTYTDGNNCSASASQTIQVKAVPVVTLAAFADRCIDAGPLTLTGGSPTGGTYSGTGVTNGVFNPATAGVGVHTITYSYTENGCTKTATNTIEVTPTPVVTLAAFNNVCVNATAFALTGGMPAGGTYSGTGVSNGQFNPAAAGVGPHTITYTYSENGCTRSATNTITVNPLPTASAGTYGAQCVGAGNQTVFNLTGGSISNGTPTWAFVSGTNGATATIANANTMSPTVTVTGTGAVTIRLTAASDQTPGCTPSATSETTLTVNALPVVSITSPVNDSYCTAQGSIPLTGNPTGGSFTVNGVTATSFNPSTLGAGSYTIIYTYTNSSGCTNTATKSVIVFPTPTVDAIANRTHCNTESGTAINFGSSVTGSTYRWTSTVDVGFGTGGTGNILAYTAKNTGATAVTATVSVWATTANDCESSVRTFTVTVNPTPTVNSITNRVHCNSDAGTSITFGGSVSGAEYAWTSTADVGFGTSGTGNIGAYTAKNTGTTAVTATVTVRATANNCQGPAQTFSVTVNPTPVATFSGVTDGQVVLSDGGNITLIPTVTGGAFSIVAPSGTTGLTAGGVLTPCTALGTETEKEITIRYTVSPSSNGVTCTAYEEKKVVLKRSKYVVVIEAVPFPTCRGQNTTYRAVVYKDPESVTYPYLVNDDGQPVDNSGNLLGANTYPIPNPNYPFPANAPQILKDNAYRYYQPIVKGGVRVNDGNNASNFTYRWTKNFDVYPFGNTVEAGNAGLSSEDYYAVSITAGPANSCITPITTGGMWSNRTYTAAPINYVVDLAADRTTICQGGSVTMTANLDAAFGFWEDIELTLYWMHRRGTTITELDATVYNTGNTVQYTTTGPSGGLQSGDVLYVEFSSVIDKQNDVNSKCSRGFTTNEVAITVVGTQTMAGGGAFCAGGAGVPVSIAGSQQNVFYQLKRDGVAVGTPRAGTGNGISFGNQTVAGAYTVEALAATGETACLTYGPVNVYVTPLPVVQTLNGGGAYCAGGAGVPVTLVNSQTGVKYQLRRTVNGTTSNVGLEVLGSDGQPIPFGNQTVAGIYSVLATTLPSTGTIAACPQTMGSVTVTVNPLPLAQTLTGGGSYCAGGAGMPVGLQSSQSGITYRLKDATGQVVATMTGTGSAISFGSFPAGSYTAEAENGTTTCSNAMTGSITVTEIALPTVYSMTGGGSYCADINGVPVGLGGSQIGINYQLRRTVGSTTENVGSPVAGTGSTISFGNQTEAGTYSILATTVATPGCPQEMGSVDVTINALPLADRIVNNQSYCSLVSNGARIVMENPEAGVTYQLVGTDPPRSFSTDANGNLSIDEVPAGTYTIQGVNNVTGCTTPSVGTVTVTDTRAITDVIGEMTYKWVGADKWELTALPETTNPSTAIPADAIYEWYVKEPGEGTVFELYTKGESKTIIVTGLPQGTEIVARVSLIDGMCQLVQFVPGEIIPLPVELLYFNATKRGSDVVLDWATASELDNKGFEVQVSSDAKNFRALGFVESKVNTTSLKQLYTFVDKENGKQGVRYYRLKQVDLDGTFEIFNIRAVHFDEVSANKVKAYPNPFHSEVELSIDAELDGELQITVTTATGQQLLQRTVQVAKGTNIEKLTLDPNLPRGVYIISTRMGDFNNHFKLLKQ
ncbi:Ig-like domain-containing protein [Pontibacter virosus]|uniref:Ig-like domain-containing protein n=1 Tax=Pontibacter virosus TaxID=1765052 RepID=A0A2U1AZ28_9BACT|nr:T9SS type A sorting domain-containing protein [Pontibacter virosus]PVY41678.1 hypothetical protein C8E01_10449 [Pontibacter virosus]